MRANGESVTLEQIGGAGVATIRGRRVPEVALADILGLDSALADDQRTLIVLRPAGGDVYALAVDRIHDHEELVVKPAAPAVMATGLYAGTTLADDGSPILLFDPAGLAKVGADGSAAAGAKPSKTLALHRRIYAAAPEAGCVIHTHSRHLVGLSLELGDDEAREDLLPPITPYFVMKVGHVPLIAYHRPGDPRVADLVAAAIERWHARGLPIRAVMLARLGPNVWHDAPASAMAVLEEIEETARLWRGCATRPTPLSLAQLAELREQFGARW